MKEQKLIQMEKNVDTAGRVINQIIAEMKLMDERLHGLTMFIQKLPNYEQILEELKNEIANTNTDNPKHSGVSDDSVPKGGLEGVD